MNDAQLQVDRVLRDCLSTFMGIPGTTPQDAEDAARALVNRAIETMSKQFDDIYEQGSGDRLLAREAQDDDLHEQFELKRSEGVTDSDIRWWWNMSPFERGVLFEQDNLNRMTMLMSLLERGLEGPAAAKEIFRWHCKFGNPSDGIGNDRPLPFELKGRITALLERNHGALEAWRRRLSVSSSLNAVVREEISKRRI